MGEAIGIVISLGLPVVLLFLWGSRFGAIARRPRRSGGQDGFRRAARALREGREVAMRLRMFLLLAPLGAGLLLVSSACTGGTKASAPAETPTVAGAPLTMADAHCFTCHTHNASVSVPISSQYTLRPMTHPVDQRGDCLVCHASAAKFPFPENHAQALSQACLTCHSPAEIPAQDIAGAVLTGGSWGLEPTAAAP